VKKYFNRQDAELAEKKLEKQRKHQVKRAKLAKTPFLMSINLKNLAFSAPWRFLLVTTIKCCATPLGQIRVNLPNSFNPRSIFLCSVTSSTEQEYHVENSAPVENSRFCLILSCFVVA